MHLLIDFFAGSDNIGQELALEFFLENLGEQRFDALLDGLLDGGLLLALLLDLFPHMVHLSLQTVALLVEGLDLSLQLVDHLRLLL